MLERLLIFAMLFGCFAVGLNPGKVLSNFHLSLSRRNSISTVGVAGVIEAFLLQVRHRSESMNIVLHL